MEKGEILVFGGGALGQVVTEQLLARNFPTYLLCTEIEKVSELLTKGFDAALVDIMDDDNLRAVGIGSGAKIIFCLFCEESKNVFLTLSARVLDKHLKIVCVAESAASGQKLLAAGASKIIDPYEISARRVYELITRPMILDMLEQTVFGQYIDIAQICLPPGSCLLGQDLFRQELAGYNLILLGVVDLELSEDLIFATNVIAHDLSADDMLVVIGPEEEIARLEDDIQQNRREHLLPD